MVPHPEVPAPSRASKGEGRIMLKQSVNLPLRIKSDHLG